MLAGCRVGDVHGSRDDCRGVYTPGACIRVGVHSSAVSRRPTDHYRPTRAAYAYASLDRSCDKSP